MAPSTFVRERSVTARQHEAVEHRHEEILHQKSEQGAHEVKHVRQTLRDPDQGGR